MKKVLKHVNVHAVESLSANSVLNASIYTAM